MEKLELKVIDPYDERLHQVSTEITDFNKDYEDIVEDMKDICLKRKAYAAAAPQFGIMERFILIMTIEEIKDLEQDINYNVTAYFNPKIVLARGQQKFYESCMSVPNATGEVLRPYYIEIEAQDINGNFITKKAEGFEAIVLCHEIDHLDGIEYTDKAKNIHYGVNIEERMQIRKDNPLKIISKNGNFNQNDLPIEVRTKIY